MARLSRPFTLAMKVHQLFVSFAVPICSIKEGAIAVLCCRAAALELCEGD